MVVFFEILIVSGILLLFAYLGIPFLYGRYAKMSLRVKAKKHNLIMLTFDDGPGDNCTPAILDVLSISIIISS